ncbi:hypothetical protein [Microbulbifer hydrolyticus]|uniref:Uncharacterized protein n=1 Tax=Microbulbifer hydrolyticus TaxID=48074 RepID=A0A6P1TCH1_9GAMM|nr:hypothetical protein [Microbulbifer hydrolyticus]MBB5213330.1 hypothetical protein [Microbulbifer hydrolyticus]QHQ40468.1 hypothetical protein GTQ55_16785 [Microbulbifer hydrolyticus]
MEQLLFPVLAVLAGGYFLIRNIIHLISEEKMMNYLKTSPKAKMWVNKYGIEKTAALTKKVFLPLGSLVAAALLGVGVWSLATILMHA